MQPIDVEFIEDDGIKAQIKYPKEFIQSKPISSFDKDNIYHDGEYAYVIVDAPLAPSFVRSYEKASFEFDYEAWTDLTVKEGKFRVFYSFRTDNGVYHSALDFKEAFTEWASEGTFSLCRYTIDTDDRPFVEEEILVKSHNRVLFLELSTEEYLTAISCNNDKNLKNIIEDVVKCQMAKAKVKSSRRNEVGVYDVVRKASDFIREYANKLQNIADCLHISTPDVESVDFFTTDEEYLDAVRIANRCLESANYDNDFMELDNEFFFDKITLTISGDSEQVLKDMKAFSPRKEVQLLFL